MFLCVGGFLGTILKIRVGGPLNPLRRGRGTKPAPIPAHQNGGHPDPLPGTKPAPSPAHRNGGHPDLLPAFAILHLSSRCPLTGV